MRTFHKVFLGIALAGLAGGSWAAVSPCVKVKAGPEKQKCYEKAIGEAEQEVADLYQGILEELTDPKAKAELEAEQRAWQQRQAQEASATRLREVEQRMTALEAWQDKLADAEDAAGTDAEDGADTADAGDTEKAGAAEAADASAAEAEDGTEETAAAEEKEAAAVPAARKAPAEDDTEATVAAEAEQPEAAADDAEDAADASAAEAEDGTEETVAAEEEQAEEKEAAAVPAAEKAPAAAKTAPAPAKRAASAEAPSKKARKTSEKEPVWMVQLGSFRTREQAEALAKEFDGKGFKLRVEESREWYAVRLWPQPDRGGALQQLREWRDKTGREDGIVVEIKNPRHDWW